MMTANTRWTNAPGFHVLHTWAQLGTEWHSMVAGPWVLGLVFDPMLIENSRD